MNALPLFAGFARVQAAREADSAPYFPRTLELPKGSIKASFLGSNGFQDIPAPLRLLVKLPDGYDGPQVDPKYILEGDVKEYVKNLDASDVQTARLVIMTEIGRTGEGTRVIRAEIVLRE
ncbi:hypothetical protein K4K53_013327 [Colletotrichum sp. SAR 10_77]|nr:hypothetical protein K4K52_010466 [Colletotrichum sp. SAR 10_76]KAI8249335.1 hypothetical protein K4K53_013327 [Colletotrichum sp. SAR 10_77]KAJ5006664.1 hypothetical protein K4K48_002831 [Colletotrichum sp. SAR 10_66]